MRIDQTEHFDRDGFSGDVYLTGDEQKGFNALRVKVHGKHPRKRMIDTTRIYLVIDGQGTFIINTDTYKAKKDDLFVIEPGSEYEYEGEMNLFEFNISPNSSFKDELV